MNSQDPKFLGLERSKRIRKLRTAAHLSRHALAEKYAKYGITESAIESWEQVRWQGLTLEGAQKLVKTFQEEGIPVTLGWLLSGEGPDPIDDRTYSRINISPIPNKVVYEKELASFYQTHPFNMDAIINDDGLAPLLLTGDYVAGIRLIGKEIEKAIGYICIAETLDSLKTVRLVMGGIDANYYTLSCTNPNTSVRNSEIMDIQLKSVAPIIVIRKAKPLKSVYKLSK